MQNPALRAFLSKTGFNQNMKRATAFGPERHRGAKFHHHHAEQGINKALQFTGQVRAQSQTGNMMMTGVETLQLMAGIGQPTFETTENLPHLPVVQEG